MRMNPSKGISGRLAWLWMVAVSLPSLVWATEKVPDFNRDIRPILSHTCFACHGPDAQNRQAGLRLDVRESATSQLDSGAVAIVPGSPDTSELIARIYDTDSDARMPPPESNHVLAAAQKEMLGLWIAAGARYDPHWAYVAPKRHSPPPAQRGDWSFNWIDAFVIGRLEAEGLALSRCRSAHAAATHHI